MWEMVVVILAVLAAATGVGYGLYRGASGKAGCAGCPGCDKVSSRGSEDAAARRCDAETQ